MDKYYIKDSFINKFIKGLSPIIDRITAPIIDLVIASNNTEMSYKTLKHNTIYIINHIQIHNNHCLLWLLDSNDFNLKFIKIVPKSFLDCIRNHGLHINHPLTIMLSEEEGENGPILYIRFRPISMYNNYLYNWTSS